MAKRRKQLPIGDFRDTLETLPVRTLEEYLADYTAKVAIDPALEKYRKAVETALKNKVAPKPLAIDPNASDSPMAGRLEKAEAAGKLDSIARGSAAARPGVPNEILLEEAKLAGQKAPTIPSAVEKLRLARTAAKSAESAKLTETLTPLPGTSLVPSVDIIPPPWETLRNPPSQAGRGLTPYVIPLGGGGRMPPTGPETAIPAAGNIPPVAPTGATATTETASSLMQRLGGMVGRHPYRAGALGLAAAAIPALYFMNRNAAANRKTEAEKFAEQLALAQAAQEEENRRQYEGMDQAVGSYQDNIGQRAPIDDYLDEMVRRTMQRRHYSDELSRYLSAQAMQPGYQEATW